MLSGSMRLCGVAAWHSQRGRDAMRPSAETALRGLCVYPGFQPLPGPELGSLAAMRE